MFFFLLKKFDEAIKIEPENCYNLLFRGNSKYFLDQYISYTDILFVRQKNRIKLIYYIGIYILYILSFWKAINPSFLRD